MTETDPTEQEWTGLLEFYGETFTVSEGIAPTAFSRFIKAARRGVDSNSPDGIVAQVDLLQQCIAPEDWLRFEDLADAKRATGDDLWQVINQASELIATRPTSRSSVSSDGPSITEPKSTSGSKTKADPWAGRPDLGVVPLRLAQTA